MCKQVRVVKPSPTNEWWDISPAVVNRPEVGEIFAVVAVLAAPLFWLDIVRLM